MLKENEKIAIKSLKEELAKRFKLEDLWLFGSKARGDDTQESDIDVMIQLVETNPETESQIYDIVYEINLKNDTFISVIIFSKYEIHEGPMAESPIYKIIQKEGVLI